MAAFSQKPLRRRLGFAPATPAGDIVSIAMKFLPATVLILCAALTARAERINQEGRILGPAPVVTNAILFNTTNADAVLSAMQIFPVTNPWNECISNRPVLPNSAAMISQITNDLATNRQTLRMFKEMNFVLVPDSQALKPIQFLDYPDESDLNGGTDPYGLYPIPTNMPVETWPSETSGQTLLQWQQDAFGWGGDRHSIVVQPGVGDVWETWQAKLVGTNWQASNGAKFNLYTNGLRPAGWTSADAAGLPMFPALVRFDECERGMVEHAMRVVVKRTRYGTYIYPATHYAAPSTNTSTNLPAMGQRLRLKASYVINPNWTKQEKAVLLGLKKYGALVADNGNFFSISVTPDDRWPAGCFDRLNTLGITNFEVVQTTGPNEGPRSPGAPTANAGPDGAAAIGVPVQLQGAVTFSNTAPVIQWKLYSGPGPVAFGDATQTNTTATFNTPGIYTLMLSADNGVHAVAYDAVVFSVAQSIVLSAALVGTNLNLSWSGGAAPFVIERSAGLSRAGWIPCMTSSVQTVSVPVLNADGFFRVRGN
jgi:hypothetical protein